MVIAATDNAAPLAGLDDDQRKSIVALRADSLKHAARRSGLLGELDRHANLRPSVCNVRINSTAPGSG